MQQGEATTVLICPHCKIGKPKIKDTRFLGEFNIVKRVRICDHCGAIFVTTEKLDMVYNEEKNN
jgi:transcriptional regulator NrdR family protein